MRNSPLYLLVLFLGICGVTGYSFFESEIITVQVTDKYIGDGRGRRGITSSSFVIRTDSGEFSISKFPVLGYAFGAEEIYNSILIGDRLKIRVGSIPPSFGKKSKHTRIFDVIERR